MTGVLSAAELASVQATAQGVCDQSCQIWRDTGKATPGTYGSSSSSRSNTAAYTQIAPASGQTLYCELSQPNDTELQNYEYLIGAKDARRLRFPVGTDVQTQDHVVIGADIYEVHVVLKPKSYETLRSVIAAEIKP